MNKDQQLLEQLYCQIYQPVVIEEISVLQEGVWKKIAPLVASAALGTSAFAADKDPAALYDVTRNDAVYAKNLASYQDNMYNMDINNIKKNIKRSFGTLADNKISQLIVEISERENVKGNYRDVVVSVTGDVLASSQEEADQLAARTVRDAILDSGIDMKDLKIVLEKSNLTKFHFVVRALIKVRN
jgi:hypothetical protein